MLKTFQYWQHLHIIYCMLKVFVISVMFCVFCSVLLCYNLTECVLGDPLWWCGTGKIRKQSTLNCQTISPPPPLPSTPFQIEDFSTCLAREDPGSPLPFGELTTCSGGEWHDGIYRRSKATLDSLYRHSSFWGRIIWINKQTNIYNW